MTKIRRGGSFDSYVIYYSVNLTKNLREACIVTPDDIWERLGFRITCKEKL